MMVYFVTNGINRMAGTERVIVQLAQALGNVIIVVPGSTECAFPGYENLNIQSVEIGDFPTEGKLLKVSHRIKYYEKLKDLIKRGVNTTVITFSFDLNLLNILLSKKIGYRPIICEHIEYNYHKGLRNIIRKQMYRQSGVTLVCLTETDKKKFARDGINTLVIPNFINELSYHYSSQSKRILSIGRLEYQKNFSFLVEAFAISKLYEKGWVLDIVGEGSEQLMIEEKINSLQMNSYIKIHRFTRDIGKYYQAAALMCMTSRFEAFPMVLLEAMNHGLPVLVTDFPTGAREILGEENEQIVKSDESSSFAQVLVNMCESNELRLNLSLQNYELVQKYYPQRVLSAWQTLLDEFD